MIPTWIWTILVVIVASIASLWLGSYLPQSGVNPITCLLLVVFAAFCVVCAVYNNFPFLMALGTWIPFFPHLLGPSSLPTIAYFLVWMAAVLFFRLCVQGYVSYRQSFTWFLLIVFAWVPIRFMMNPVTKLGATAGGSGVSGALPYFNYVLAAGLLIFLGAVLTDRNRVTYFMRWCNVIVLISGVALTICAFIPATAPYLWAMGSFATGEQMGDGIQRLVQLPGYGLYLVEASLCPALCRLKGWQCCFLFVLGFFMIILGGNRSAIAAAVIVVPAILFLRKQSHATFLSLFLMLAGIGMLRVTVDSLPPGQIPPLMRSFGVFDSTIDKASGGDASANWRYAIWQDGWKKIMENPLVGKGFGNLPEHVDSEDASSTDFEKVLAGGEAHNGFVTAAYGFGIPFMVALSIAVVYYFFKEASLALRSDKHDPEIRDLHAFLAGMFISYPVLIYTAFDLSITLLWTYVGISCVLSNLPRQQLSQPTDAGLPLRKYGEEHRAAGSYSYRPR